MIGHLRRAELAVQDWVEEVALLGSDEADDLAVEALASALFDDVPYVCLLAVLPFA